MNMLKKWNIKDEQAQKKCVEEVLNRIDEQADSPFGVIAAQEIIDIVSAYVGPATYNTAIDEAKKSVEAKLADLEVDLDVLKSYQI
jgi:uncharacterized protein (DUF2164 family)